ncbi:MAG TPA: phosphoribosylformylglycinamidine cyclo-ligase [Acidimicrobiia bacterium]|jgi:phosphoribosylformylglycinamidine cyclo-ligase|nr:phosphoribosylformylglycinamidine cyclo-ligase [Acidimicrobiia bacterium]
MTTYGEAGVDLEGADRHVDAIRSPVTATWTDDVVGSFGGFAAGVTIPTGYREPVLMMSTDGVGTKLELARRARRWDGVGHDLVAVCVDDLAAVGARALGFVDYLAVGALDRDRDQVIVESVAAACVVAGCPLLGGETAEHPGVMEPDAVDLAGAVMGVVERGQELGPALVREGDLILGLVSPNLRSNGFSLIRALFGNDVDPHLEMFLEPSVIYAPDVLNAVNRGGVHAAAHITGGGLAGNLVRVLPAGLGAHIDSDAWDVPPVFRTVASRGVTPTEMWSTFNMGIGFCLVIAADAREAVIAATSAHQGRIIGKIVPGDGVTLE